MKKLIFIIALLFSYNSFAQDSVFLQPKKTKSFLGFDRIGVFATPEQSAEYFIFIGTRGKMYPSYNFGVSTFKPLSKRWDLHVGLGYNYKKYDTGNMPYRRSIRENGVILEQIEGNEVETYITQDIIVPINFFLTYGQNNKIPLFYFLSMGTELGFLLNHKIERDFQNEAFPNQFLSTRAGTIGYKKRPLNFQRLNLHFGFGLGWEFKNKTSLRVEPHFKADLMDIFSSGLTIAGNPTFSRGVRFMYTYSFRK